MNGNVGFERKSLHTCLNFTRCIRRLIRTVSARIKKPLGHCSPAVFLSNKFNLNGAFHRIDEYANDICDAGRANKLVHIKGTVRSEPELFLLAELFQLVYILLLTPFIRPQHEDAEDDGPQEGGYEQHGAACVKIPD